MAKIEDYDLLESDPLKVRGEHYDLVINGVEVGGGSRRIHDPALQQYILKRFYKFQISTIVRPFIESIEYGLSSTCWFGIRI